MALLAEELVEEWLNRQGYFTIRGVKVGVHEVDILAIRPNAEGLECRHIEVQISIRPISYITKLVKSDQKTMGKAASSAAPRTPPVYDRAVAAWIEKKFDLPAKLAILKKLAPGPWTRELVVHNVKDSEELRRLSGSGVTIVQLADVLSDLAAPSEPIGRAGAGDLVELLWLGKLAAPIPAPEAIPSGEIADD